MRDSTKIWLAVLSALTTAIAFPPYKTGFFIFLAPVLLLLIIDDTRSMRKVFAFGYIWGLAFNLGTLYGVFWATIGGTFGMLAVISLLPAINSLAYKFITKKSRVFGLIIWPLLWVSWDYLRTLSQLNFPWNDYGYALTYYLPIIQPAEIFGIYGVSLMIHVVNVLLYLSLQQAYKRKTRVMALAISILLPMLFLIYGWLRLPSQDTSEGDLDIALIQGNITRDVKWQPGGREVSFNRYIDMTGEAIENNADFIIWPETALPFYLLHKPNELARVKDIVDSTGVSILTGIPQYEAVGKGEYIYFNAAALFSPRTDSVVVYEKIKLVPGSERIPFSGRFKILKEIRLGQADFSSGRNRTIFKAKKSKFATLICFESVFPGYCADFCRNGAQFLVVITNDMWFGPSSLPYAHARMSIFRAVENRVPIARCANTGISMFIDRWGRVSGETDTFETVIRHGSISPEISSSIYNKLGDILPVACLAGSLIVLITFAFLRRGKYNGSYEN